MKNKIPSVASPMNDVTDGSLWTRFYAESVDRQLVCNTIKNNEKQYKFIVVGHCPTNNFSQLSNIMNTNKDYDNCDRLGNDRIKGCVVVDTCRDKYNAPVLAFVDTALSQAFRKTGNKDRNIELLHLSEDSTQPKITGRKYNVISRLEVRNDQEPVDIRIF
jgi:hypothetical protein